MGKQELENPVDTSENSPSIAFSANFARYPASLTAKLRRIDKSLAVIQRAALLPAAADQLCASAKAGTVHHSTLIEGNQLPLVEAERATRGELEPDTKAKIELVNYVETLALLDLKEEADELGLTSKLLLELHGQLMAGLGHPDSHFKPHHEGAWRDGVAVVPDPITGQIMHEGSPQGEVPGRMAGLVEWVANSEERTEEYPAPVIAGVVHYAVTEIHPFADGNGRMARIAATAVLQQHGYLPGRLFSFEGYYAKDKPAYLKALRSVREQTYNMQSWLEYFLEGLALEYERVVEEIDQLAQIGLTQQSSVQLKRSQQRGLSSLYARGARSFSRSEYEEAAGIQRSTATDDIADLRSKKLIRVISGTRGPSTRYVLTSQDVRGRPRKWTTNRIDSELRDFLGDRNTWPTVKEFRDADLWGLYLAIQRNGGTTRWLQRFGLQD